VFEGQRNVRSSLSSCAFEIPTDDPSRAGLTKTGKPNGLSAASPVRNVKLRVTGTPWSRITDLKRSLSMASEDAATPAPT